MKYDEAPRAGEVVRWVIWDPAPNRVVGIGDDWTKKQAERFLRDHPEVFGPDARVEREDYRR